MEPEYSNTHPDRVHELGCYLEVELSSYVDMLRARFG